MSADFHDNWTTQLRKGLLELCILNVIRETSLYGYEIVRHLRQIKGLVIREGTIYPILSRFKREGLVETSIRESSEGPPRKYYRLTAAGRRQLDRMNQAWQEIAGGVQRLRTESSQ